MRKAINAWLDRTRVPASLLAIFLCGAMMAFGSSAFYYNAVIKNQAGAYERQVDRLTTQLTAANAQMIPALDELLVAAAKSNEDLAAILVALRTATVNVRGATKDVKKATESVIKAQEALPVPAVPAPVPKPERSNQPVLPYQERRIEY